MTRHELSKMSLNFAIGLTLMLGIGSCASFREVWGMAAGGPSPDEIRAKAKSNVRNQQAEVKALRNLNHFRDVLSKNMASQWLECPRDLPKIIGQMHGYEEELTISVDITTTPTCGGGWYYDPAMCKLSINSCESDSTGKKRYIDW